MMVAVEWNWGFRSFNFGSWVFLALAFLLGWLLNYFLGGKFGKRREEVLRRVVDTSTDESTRIRTLADDHSNALRLKDDALLKAKSEHEAALASLRADYDKVQLTVKDRDAQLLTHKNESTRLQGLIGNVDTSKKELEDTRAQLSKYQAEHESLKADYDKHKGDYERSIGDWRKRLETTEAAKIAAEKKAGELEGSHKAVLLDWQNKFTSAEAAKVAAEKKVVDVDATHKRTLGEWETKVKAAEAKQTEVQGLLGNAKADNDRALADWRKRAETAEASVAASNKRVTELEARVGAMEADHSKVVVDWQARVKAAEAKQTEIQGLVGSSKADNEKVVADWRARYATLEGELASARAWEGKHNSLLGERDGLRKASSDWEAKYNSLVGERDGLRKASTDWEAKYNGLVGERDGARKSLGEWEVKYNALVGERDGLREGSSEWEVRYNGLVGERDGLRKGSSEWESKFNGLVGERDGLRKASSDWEVKYNALVKDRDSLASERDRLRGAASEWETKHNSLLSEHTKIQEAKASAPDDLLVIEGIGPKINQALRADGLTRWVDVRDASEGRLRSAIEKAGIAFAPSLTTWSKQAEYLAAGDREGFKAYTDYLISGQDPSRHGGRPVESADGVQTLVGDSATDKQSANRDVAVEMDPAWKTKGGNDNLLVVEGIGPKFNEALLASGISTFAKVAAASEADLRRAIERAGLSFAPSLTTWAEQAALLAKGDKAGFEALTARLVAGRNDG